MPLRRRFKKLRRERYKKYIWPLIGILAMVLALRILYNKLSGISLEDVLMRLADLSAQHWFLAVFFSILAYAALAGYDRIALKHLGKKISWVFITLCSFTTYALSHNIGASVFSGAVVRYRAYSAKGLDGAEIAVLVGLCSFTFVLGTILLSGLVLTLSPNVIDLLYEGLPHEVGRIIGFALLGLVMLYVFGSWWHFKPMKIGKFRLTYPRLNIVAQQLVVGPLELLGAAGIIYAVLPEAGNPGFIVVLGVFLASFSATLLSNAPAGGIGVLEAVFIAGMAAMEEADVLAALIVFRLLYLIVPLILSLFFVALFEISQWSKRRHNRNSS